MENKAIKIAQLIESDHEDMRECVQDLMENSKLDANTAVIVAKAIRNKYLPKVAQQLELDQETTEDILNNELFDLNQSTLIDRKTNDMEAYASNGSNNDLVDEIGNNDDNKVTTASNFDNVRNIVAEALSDPEFNQFVKIEDDFDLDPIEANDIYTENERSAQSNNNRNENEQNNKRGENMNQKELNERKAQRRNKLIREAEQLLNASTESFQYAADEQYNTDREYPKMTMQSSEGNSLKKETEEFSRSVGKATVPTMNPAEDLLLRDDIDIFKFDSSPDGGLEYTLPKDMFDLEIPATNINIGDEFEVPTQLGRAPRKTTIAMDMEEDEDFDTEPEGEDESFDIDMSEEDGSFGDEDEDLGEDEDFTEDEESFGESGPSEALHMIESFEDDELNEFLAGFTAWAEENGVDLSGHGDMEGMDEMESEAPESRESIASVLGPEFDLDKAENVLYNQLVNLNVDPDDIQKLTYAQGIELANKIITSQNTINLDKDMTKLQLAKDMHEEEEMCEGCGKPMSECDCEECVGCGKSKPKWSSNDVETKIASIEKAQQIREARLKTAYDIWSRLAAHNFIDHSAIAENVDTWMEEGLTVKAMVSQGNMMIQTAQNAARRQKTASNGDNITFSNALATTPAFTSSVSEKPAVLDLKSALRGVFTMPEIEEN